MTDTYFAESTLEIVIPQVFDAAKVKATLAELMASDGGSPKIADEATLRVALEHATSAEQVKRLRELTDYTPALHAAFLRLVPEKQWADSISVYDSLTNLFAIIRKLKCKNPHSKDLELRADAEHLTDAELAALFPALIDRTERENG